MAAETNAISFRKLLSENTIVLAEQMVTKWDPNASRSPYAKVASIFLESRDEARRFLSAVHDVHQSMQHSTHSDGSLLRKQILLETAMNRLKKEFAEILILSNIPASSSSTVLCADASSTFRSYLTDYESEGEGSFPTAALDYLRKIVECMISSGYEQDCLEIYKLRRRVVVEEGMSRLGFEQVSSSHVQKLNWESLDFKIKQWLAAAPAVFAEIFTGERLLCDRIFAGSESNADSCFSDVVKDAAVSFFRFPFVMASKSKRPPEKLFHYLNMYRKIVELSPEIESTFSSKATTMVHSQVTASLEKLAEAIKSMLAEFESSIHKDSSKVTPPDGGLHPLTQSVMDHVVLLADYGDILAELYADHPPPCHGDLIPKPAVAVTSKKLEPIEEETPDAIESPSKARLAWFVTVLLCKLDVKAELYKEAWQSYLFLANNHQHVVNRFEENNKLSKLVDQEWLSTHEKNARSFARSFLRLAWKKVLEAIPTDPSSLVEVEGIEAARERMVQFNKTFEKTCKSQAGWVVLDRRVRTEIKSAITRNVVGAYRPFYERCRTALRAAGGMAVGVRFAPEDMLNHLSTLYYDNIDSLDWESLPVMGIDHGKGSRWRRTRESR